MRRREGHDEMNRLEAAMGEDERTVGTNSLLLALAKDDGEAVARSQIGRNDYALMKLQNARRVQPRTLYSVPMSNLRLYCTYMWSLT